MAFVPFLIQKEGSFPLYLISLRNKDTVEKKHQSVKLVARTIVLLTWRAAGYPIFPVGSKPLSGFLTTGHPSRT